MNIEMPREALIELTRLNPFERFANGRPRVPDDLLHRMEPVTSEQAWSVLKDNNYNFQFEGNWFRTHPEKILVGRAVTAMMVPYRPDFHDLVQEQGEADRRIGGQNSWVIDTLGIDDVLVVDMFGKIKDGTFLGDNLSTSVQARTKRGAVIDGGIRDYQGVMKLPECAVFCRGVDPTPIADVTLVGVNLPIRIGQATVLPGDIVLGTPTGVYFIPPTWSNRWSSARRIFRCATGSASIVCGSNAIHPAKSMSANGQITSKRIINTGCKAARPKKDRSCHLKIPSIPTRVPQS